MSRLYIQVDFFDKDFLKYNVTKFIDNSETNQIQPLRGWLPVALYEIPWILSMVIQTCLKAGKLNHIHGLKPEGLKY